MDWHRPEKARFTVQERAEDIIVACQYWQVSHSRNAAGNIAGIVFPYGSGRNILAGPCLTQISTATKSFQTRNDPKAPGRL
ncbi:MAG: hypothetical protein Q8O57_04230, partial [Kiritimatiellota bacterium]|nr:hypothetical protein [Kiritimatiellota bacterium]